MQQSPVFSTSSRTAAHDLPRAASRPRRLTLALAAGIAGVSAIGAALAGNADLDPSYGGGSFLRQLTVGGNNALAGALQPDGKLLLGGYSNNYFAAARYLGDALDVAPDAASFTPANGVAPSSVQTSNAITVSGLTAGAKVPLSITGGFYSINGAPGTSQPGHVGNGDVVVVAHTASAVSGGSVGTTLRFGGLSPSNNPVLVLGTQTVATFTSTTQ